MTSAWHCLEKSIITSCTISVPLFRLAINMTVTSAEVECRGPMSKSGLHQPPIRAFLDDLRVTTTSVPSGSCHRQERGSSLHNPGKQQRFPDIIASTPFTPDMVLLSREDRRQGPWEYQTEEPQEKKRGKYADLVSDCSRQGQKSCCK